MEKKYIELEKAIAVAMDYDGDGNAQDASQDIAGALGAIPTADVVEVVRCKDCRWWRSEDGYCKIQGNYVMVDDNDFCSQGHRREK